MDAVFTYMTPVMSRGRQPASWEERFAGELAEEGTVLGADGLLWQGEAPVGEYRLLTVEQGRALVGEELWTALAQQGRFTGTPVGCFGWSHDLASDEEARALLLHVVRVAQGPILRTDSRQVWLPVRVREFSLDNLVRKHGFHDLLGRDEEYLEYVRQEVLEALRCAGLEGAVGTWDHDNPVRLADGTLRRGEEPVPEAVLGEVTAPVWGFDYGVLKDPALLGPGR